MKNVSVAGLAWRLLLGCAVVWLTACSSTGEGGYDETRDWSAERLYTEAKEEMLAGDYKKAISYYEKLGARYPYGRYAQQAQLELAYAYFRNKEPAQALATADRFIKLYPEHPNVDYAYYLKGLVNFNEDLGLFGGLANQDMSERDPRGARESFEAFRDLVTRFPESRYAEDAQSRMRYLTNALGMYEVHVARYYYARGAYVAAANRAQASLINYPQTPSNEHALDVMEKSYRKLGLTQLADDAHQILTKTFPESVYVAGVPEKPWWKFW